MIGLSCLYTSTNNWSLASKQGITKKPLGPQHPCWCWHLPLWEVLVAVNKSSHRGPSPPPTCENTIQGEMLMFGYFNYHLLSDWCVMRLHKGFRLSPTFCCSPSSATEVNLQLCHWTPPSSLSGGLPGWWSASFRAERPCPPPACTHVDSEGLRILVALVWNSKISSSNISMCCVHSVAELRAEVVLVTPNRTAEALGYVHHWPSAAV